MHEKKKTKTMKQGDTMTSDKLNNRQAEQKQEFGWICILKFAREAIPSVGFKSDTTCLERPVT